MSSLSGRLDEAAHWDQALSLGEQQKLAIARVLLIKPDWLFLDEATSATDEQEEAALYHAVTEALPATTVISIGHRVTLESYHRRVIAFAPGTRRPGRLIDQTGSPPGHPA